MEYPVSRSENFKAILCGILPNATEDAEGTLFVFEVHNTGDEKRTWWYDELTLTDSAGTEHDLGTGSVRGYGTAKAENFPDGWKTSPRISSNSRTKTVTDLTDPNDEIEPRRIEYEYDGESFEFELTAEDVELLRERPREFVLDDWEDRTFDGPYQVAVVQDVTERGVHVDLGGTGLGQVVSAPLRVKEELRPGTHVAVTESNRIDAVLDAGMDNRVDAMISRSEPDVSYEDVGGLDAVVRDVREVVELPLVEPETFESVGIDPPSGVLLHGPPGTGKTLIARAVAGETDATFLRLSASELAQKYVGEGAGLVRDLFEAASQNAPAIVFIDEIDAIASTRSDSKSSGGEEVQRTLMQLLSELDGFDKSEEVRIIAATNRVDRLDSALLRPGRFDRLIEVPIPEEAGRRQILDIHTAPLNTASDIDFEELVGFSDGMSGADLEAACTEAGLFAIRDGRETITQIDLLRGIQSMNTGETKSDPDHVSPIE